MKRHAFIFQVHKAPELFGRILKVLESETHYFFVNVDAKASFNDFKNAVEGIANVIFMPKRWNVHHCGHSQFLCTLDMLRYAKSYPIDFDFIHQISGQDYPLRSNEQFDNFFESTDYSYMCLEGNEFHEKAIKQYYPQRVNYWYPANPNASYLNLLYYRTHLKQLIGRLFNRQIIDGLWGGWSWFSWNKRTWDFVLNYIEEHPDYLKRFLYTSAADELIFNTIIHGREAELLVKPYMPLRYVSWTSNRFIADPRRPYTLNELDYDDFMDKNVFFCRKVDLPESEKLLDMIDRQRGKPFDCLNAESLFPHLEL